MVPGAAALLALCLLLAPRGGPAAAARSFTLTESAENAGAFVIARPAWQQILPNTPVGTPQITVVKSVIGDAPVADWAFNGSPDIGNFTLPAAGGGQTFGDLAVGEHTISETDVGGWVPSVSCAPGGETGNDSVSVTLADGDAVTCTFINTLCLAGTYDNGVACAPADPGYYVDTNGATAQIECLLGYYSSNPGATACVAADPGYRARSWPADGQDKCDPGTYQPNSGKYFCFEADQGWHVPDSGATQQTACEPGEYQNEEGQDFCRTAPPGTYTDNYASVWPTDCSSGTYQPDWGRTFCFNASPGNYVPISGSSQQYPCNPGTVQPDDGQSSCRGAYPGYYAPNSGMADELPCEPGTYQDEHGQTSCKPAPAGTYAPDPAMTAPLNCPSGYTSEEGATECYAATADLTITKGTDPAGGTGFPFTLDPGTVTFEHKWGSNGVAAGAFNGPFGVAVDGAGNVYVADTFAYRVQKFDADGNFILMWGRDVKSGTPTGYEVCLATDTCKAGVTGSGNGEFNLPHGVAVDAAGNVYVSDSANDRIQKFDANGNYLDQWGDIGGLGGQFDNPNGVAVDEAGNVYVADAFNNRIQKFTADGTFLLAWGYDVVDDGTVAADFEICTPSDTCWAGISGTGDGQMEGPVGVTTYGGRVYVADTFNHRVQVFDTNGNYLDQWGSEGSGDGQFNHPYGLTADAAGNIYVADSNFLPAYTNDRIQKFDGNGNYLGQWGSEGTGNGQFTTPAGVAASGASIYVTEYGGHRVQRFSQTGAVLDDGQSHTFEDLAPGTYLVSELVPDGWDLTGIDCNGGSPDERGNTVEVTLAAGDAVTCTFSNTEDAPPPTTADLTIAKSVTGTGAPVDWSFTFNGSLGGFNLTDEDPDNAATNQPPGLFVIGEANPAGYTTTVSCDSGDTAADGNLMITLAAGDDVTCTFTNAICQPGNFDTATSWACAAADPGHFVSTVGAAAQTACAPGYYQPAAGAATCIQAGAGYYAPGPAATEQTACPAGTTSPPGSDSIDDCVAAIRTLTLSKTTDEPGYGSLAYFDWPFADFNGSNPGDVTVDVNGAPLPLTGIDPGVYDITEVVADGWDLASVTCNGQPMTITNSTVSVDLTTENMNCVFHNAPESPATETIFFSAKAAGETGDGVAFGPHDILGWDGSAWSKWFNGDDAGLTPNGKAIHNINAFWIPDPNDDDLVLSFGQNRRTVPDIGHPVDGMDLVWWDGTTFAFYFDGSDVDLKNKTQEKIDALHILPGSASPLNGGNCLAYLLISTQGPGKVLGHNGKQLKFGGEDVLGFCATSLGEDTAGLWHMVLDGSAEGMPKNSLVSLSVSPDMQTLYLTTRAVFNVDAASGGHSMVYRYDFGSGAFSGPVFNAPAEGLTKQVDGLQVEGELP